MKHLTLVAIVGLFAGCGSDTERPIPCAAQQQCPGGLACVANECVMPGLDGHCEIGDHDLCPADLICSVGDERLGYGACELPCDDNADCLTLDQRRCIVLPSATAARGACMPPCDGDRQCPPNTECQTLPGEDSRYCMPAGLPALGGECLHDDSCQVLTPDSFCALDESGVVYGCQLPCSAGTCDGSTVCTPSGSRSACVPDCTTAPCPDGFTCDASKRCYVAARPGERCDGPEDCTALQECRTIDGVDRCVEN